MEVTDELITKLGNLSRLRFEPAQKETLKHDLEKMIAFIEKLQEVDTSNVEPLLFMTTDVNVFREDVVRGSITRSEGLKNAPLKDDSFFKVPKVIRK